MKPALPLLPDRSPLLWVILPLALVLAPHALKLPLWISLSWALCAAWSLYAAQRAPSRGAGWLKILLTLGGVTGVLLHYGTVLGPGGGVALLAFLSGAKLLECASPRDRIGLLFVGCFLLVAHFLDAQSLATAAYMVLAALALVAGLIANQIPSAQPRPTLLLAARLLLQALPLALLLFVLFPRMHGPLWGLPQQGAAKTGLSERMAPGDFGQLILSDAIAFRVAFAGAQPDSRQLYWRGPVLWDYDGRSWLTHRAIPADPLEGAGRGPTLRYAVTLEPHRQRWLFLLGLPKALPPLEASLTPDWQWLAREPVTQRLRYQVEAYPDYLINPVLSPATRARALALPEGGNPRARAWAASLAARAGDRLDIVNQVLNRFRAEPFFYTLNPPRLGADAVDEFLFGARRGFCEHYASTFVFLMRAAGVPARVVTGYQGGEFNRLGQYWIVRDRDAHAWAEVWLNRRGWVRVDPTAAVAPTRVEQGVNAALPAAERPGGVLALEGDWLGPLRLGWDLVNNNWNQWVLGYNQERQRQFLSSLSPFLTTLQGMAWALALGGGLIVLALAARLLRPRPARRDAASRAYARFCARLARLGLPRGPAEGAAAYARRAGAARPDLAGEIDAITRRYIGLRYGQAGTDELRGLERAVRGFAPSRRAAP